MKLTIANLEKAKELAGQRVFLEGERKKLATPAPLTKAVARVTFQGATMRHPVEVEISEGKAGAIGTAILKCIRDDIDGRIALLNEQLAAMGIELEDAA